MNRKRYCIANWKMNFTSIKVQSFINNLNLFDLNKYRSELIICPSFTDLIIAFNLSKNTKIQLGAQNIYHKKKGAYTGEVSCYMLQEIGCQWVILGHSERRKLFNETR